MILWWLACSAPAPPPEITERAALQAVELARTDSAVVEALDSGEVVLATELYAAGVGLDRARFLPLRPRLDERIDAASPADAARAHGILYTHATTPKERDRHRGAVHRFRALTRWTPAQREATLADVEGVTRAVADRALADLRREHLHPVDERAVAAAMQRRVTALATAWSVDLPPHAPGLDGCGEAGIAAGLPPELVWSELTLAAFETVDPWGSPVWPSAVRAWSEFHQGKVDGRTGVQLEPVDEGVRVAALHPNGPAWTAGMHVGDEILSAGPVVVSELPTDAPRAETVAATLRGDNGTTVEVRLKRAGAERTLTLTRGSLVQPTVMGWKRSGSSWSTTLEPGIALLRIAGFRPHTPAEFERLLPERAGLQGMILDVRGNGGGDLDAAIAIADVFLAAGKVVDVQGRVIPPFPEGWNLAQSGSPFEDLPLVVLVDGATASSAEVLAGALQQAGHTIVGSRTTGKGTSQVLRVHEDLGFALQFTNLGWALPDGRRLQRTDQASSWGVQPDHLLKLTPTESFAAGVLQAQRESLSVHADGSAMPIELPRLDDGIPPLTKDPAVARAATLLRR